MPSIITETKPISGNSFRVASWVMISAKMLLIDSSKRRAVPTSLNHSRRRHVIHSASAVAPEGMQRLLRTVGGTSRGAR